MARRTTGAHVHARGVPGFRHGQLLSTAAITVGSDGLEQIGVLLDRHRPPFILPLLDVRLVLLHIVLLLVPIHGLKVTLLVLHRLADRMQVFRVEPLLLRNLPLHLQSLDLFPTPLAFSSFHHLALHFTVLLRLLDVDLLNFKLDAAKLDNIVPFERVLLLNVSIGDVSHDQVDLLESVARVVQLLT